ncbi:hypothetical protein LTR85_001352 [Meristemomyces frigidus]|nr:hypothetical protein LTR85_001352 [Meristemomyces frigidus]
MAQHVQIDYCPAVIDWDHYDVDSALALARRVAEIADTHAPPDDTANSHGYRIEMSLTVTAL